MKHLITFTILISSFFSVFSQTAEDLIEGTISYVTSQSAYVRFSSTGNIHAGDTLFILKDGQLEPALLVENTSSISCVCQPLSGYEPILSEKIYFKQERAAQSLPEPSPETPAIPVVVPEIDSVESVKTSDVKTKKEQSISGRIAISSYSNFSGSPAGNSQRMRYTLSLNARNIARTGFSAETYISFSHSSEKWDLIQDNIFNGLKIYSLAFRYDFKNDATLLFGRKINPKLSSIGAIDGLQFDKRFGAFSFGLVAGSRPDYSDYSFNTDLMQFGAYISHEMKKGAGIMQNTLAFVDQENSWNTDRRFLYYQHNNTLLKNLYVFGSIELDLYEKIDEQKENTFNLTNFYILLRYRVLKQLSFSLSYSARNNVIYYETYKDIVERLMESTTLQGFSFQVNYRPISKLSVGLKTGYRSRKEDPRPSINGDLFVTYSQIPVLNVAANASFTMLQTAYLTGKIFTIGFSRDILPGKLYCGVNYRYVDYRFYPSESRLAQNMAEINMNWSIYKKLMLSVNYEGTFEKNFNYSHLYINLTQRF